MHSYVWYIHVRSNGVSSRVILCAPRVILRAPRVIGRGIPLGSIGVSPRVIVTTPHLDEVSSRVYDYAVRKVSNDYVVKIVSYDCVVKTVSCDNVVDTLSHDYVVKTVSCDCVGQTVSLSHLCTCRQWIRNKTWRRRWKHSACSCGKPCRIALRFTPLRHTATHCNTLQ